ncbi:sphingosine kinase 1 [Cladorrhinum sp. PSN259]|nr:sphingosine kinase 1 [Cladorrhinum sp. PSN259]
MSLLRWFVRPFKKRTRKLSADASAKKSEKAEVHMPKAAANTTNNTSSDAIVDNSNNEDAVANLNRDEIIFIKQSPDSKGGGYLIYSLKENTPSSSPESPPPSDKKSEDDDTKPFSLTTTHFRGAGAQLPKDLIPYLLPQDGPPPPHFITSDRAVHVVVSTHSGLQLASSFYSAVLEPLLGIAFGLSHQSSDKKKKSEEEEEEEEEGKGTHYELTVTNSKNSVKEFAASLKGNETILLLSGDGGVVDLINSFSPSESAEVKQSPVIALLPLGTANALFHSLHKRDEPSSSSSLVLALRTLLKGDARDLPTFRASFSPGSKLAGSEDGEEVDHLRGAIVTSYGFHASLVHESDTPQYRVHGSKRFGMAAAELLKLSHGYDCRVQVRRRPGEKEFEEVKVGGGEKFSYVLVTLVSNLEKTFTISPESKVLDGKLRLVYFGDVGGERTMDIMKAAYDEGKHVRMEEVGYEDVEEVRVEVRESDERWRVVCVDGTVVEVGEGGWVSVKREEGEKEGKGWRVLVG